MVDYNELDNVEFAVQGDNSDWCTASLLNGKSLYSGINTIILSADIPSDVESGKYKGTLVLFNSEYSNAILPIFLNIDTIDLSISDENIMVSSLNPYHGEQININVCNISNRYEIDLKTIEFSLTIDDETVSNTIIAIPALSSVSHSFTWRAIEGNHEIKVSLDPNDNISEENELNNIGVISINVKEMADLRIQESDISIRKKILDGEKINISVNISNIGESPAYNIFVCFIIDNITLYDTTININDSSKASVTTTWNAIAGDHTLKVYVEGPEKFEERDRLNNNATIVIHVLSLPQLSIMAEEMKIVPKLISDGDDVTFQVLVHNNGEVIATDVNVVLLIDDIEIQSKKVNIDAQSSTLVSFHWHAEVGEHQAKLAIDTNHNFHEINEKDNVLFKIIIVKEKEAPSSIFTELNLIVGGVILVITIIIVILLLMVRRKRKNIPITDNLIEDWSDKKGQKVQIKQNRRTIQEDSAKEFELIRTNRRDVRENQHGRARRESNKYIKWIEEDDYKQPKRRKSNRIEIIEHERCRARRASNDYKGWVDDLEEDWTDIINGEKVRDDDWSNINQVLKSGRKGEINECDDDWSDIKQFRR